MNFPAWTRWMQPGPMTEEERLVTQIVHPDDAWLYDDWNWQDTAADPERDPDDDADPERDDPVLIPA